MNDTAKRPNILVFMTDQERLDVTMPGHPCRTPNLERLQREGLTFTHAFTPMTHCSPARASLMTGMYPSKHGVHNNVANDPALSRTINEECETWSEKLRAAGYDLTYTGKWHVSATRRPGEFGWEEQQINAARIRPHSDWHGYFSMPRNDTVPRKRGELVARGWYRRRLYGTSPKSYEQTNEHVLLDGALERLRGLASGEKPWCLFVSMGGPHAPFVIPEKYATMYDPAEIELPANYKDEMSDRPRLYQRMQERYSQFSEQEVREAMAHYYGYCTMLDDMLGEALQALDETGQADDTFVLFVSDHGEFLGSHGLFAKGLPAFDESYRIPCVMRWPNGIRSPGRRIDEFVTLCDLSPTFTELAGAEPTADPSGRSLVPFLKGETPEDWPDAFYNQCNGVEIYYSQRMVRTKKYKLVYAPSSRDELYDLEKDPYEMNNLIDKPEMQPVVEALFKKLWTKAEQERDIIGSCYHTISLAPVGPAVALGVGD